MNPIRERPWLDPDKIVQILKIEPMVIVLLMGVFAWLIYKVLLKSLSDGRHEMLFRQFKSLVIHSIFAYGFYAGFLLLGGISDPGLHLIKAQGILGLFSIGSLCIVFIRTSRLLLFEYLFLGHMREGVPVLLVNLFSLILTALVGGWIVSDLFQVKVGVILGTSAFFSIVVGLALQDTLGNLFAGVSLQIDKPFEIGDWVEINHSGTKWVGQVDEITWRATVLMAVTDEVIVIPNRIMAQAQISNFSPNNRPIARGQVFKISHAADAKKVREVLVSCVKNLPGVLSTPSPNVYLSEVNENWAQYRLYYFIRDYGRQWEIQDQILRNVLSKFSEEGIEVARSRLEVTHSAVQIIPN